MQTYLLHVHIEVCDTTPWVHSRLNLAPNPNYQANNLLLNQMSGLAVGLAKSLDSRNEETEASDNIHVCHHAHQGEFMVCCKHLNQSMYV